jgi:hypothetical protein
LGLATLAACKALTAAPEGGECFLATDCEPGLVCVPRDDVRDPCNPPPGGRVCSADLSKINATTCGPPTGGGGDASAEASSEAGEAAADAPVADVPVDVPRDVPRDVPADVPPDVPAPTDASDAGGE